MVRAKWTSLRIPVAPWPAPSLAVSPAPLQQSASLRKHSQYEWQGRDSRAARANLGRWQIHVDGLLGRLPEARHPASLEFALGQLGDSQNSIVSTSPPQN